MRRIAFLFVLALVMGLVPAMADTTWSFSYVGVTDPTIYGLGNFTTGTPYGDGWLPVTSITGTTNFGAITVLDTTGGVGVDPPGSLLNGAGTFRYDNAFSPISPNFTYWGLLFDVISGPPASPVNLYFDGGQVEYSYATAETAVTFTATQVPDGGTTLSLLGLALVGLAGLRRKLSL
jgi:hypothetical protein